MMLRFLAVLVFVVALVAACGEAEEEETLTPTPGGEDTPGPTPAPTVPVEFETFLQGQNSGIASETPSVEKITSEEDWAELWSRHQSIMLPTTEPPEVDFESQMIVAVFDREQPTGGYAITIDEIVSGEVAGDDGSPEIVNVNARRTAPGAGCVVTQALTQPFHMVVTEQMDGHPGLTVAEEVVDCDGDDR